MVVLSAGMHTGDPCCFMEFHACDGQVPVALLLLAEALAMFAYCCCMFYAKVELLCCRVYHLLLLDGRAVELDL